MINKVQLIRWALVWLLIGAIIVLIGERCIGQGVITRDRTIEVGANFGMTDYLGDIQGNRGTGKTFLKDLNTANSKMVKGFFLTYYPKATGRIGMRMSINMISLTAADSLIADHGGAELFRKRRNLHFRTDIYEVNVVAEYYLSKRSFRPFVVAGVGLISFTPRAMYQNEWVDLSQYHTEGIKYKTKAFELPVGFGFKFCNGNKVLSAEVLHRFTSTDYLDDVSTVYPDPYILTEAGRELSYRNSGYKPGDQRGDERDMDSFFSVAIKLSVLLNQNLRYNQKQTWKCPVL